MDSKDILEQIRSKQAETNIKYSNIHNIKEEIRNKKEESLPLDEIKQTMGFPPDLLSLPAAEQPVSLREPTTSTGVEVVQSQKDSTGIPATKPKLVMPEVDMHYAKISVRRPTRQTHRRKINMDFVQRDSNQKNAITFSGTNKLYEWQRDISRDLDQGRITPAEHSWYQTVADKFKELKMEGHNYALIAKGNPRGTSNTIRYTAAIYTGTHVHVWIRNWYNEFELEAVTSGRASQMFESTAEYRNGRATYIDVDFV